MTLLFSKDLSWFYTTCLNKEISEQIGSIIGKVVIVDAKREGFGWDKFLRVRVDIDITKPLTRVRLLKIGEKQLWIGFKYEHFPNFYFHYRVLKHKERGCSKMNQGEQMVEEV